MADEHAGQAPAEPAPGQDHGRPDAPTEPLGSPSGEQQSFPQFGSGQPYDQSFGPPPPHGQPYGYGQPYGQALPYGQPYGYGQPAWQAPVAYPPYGYQPAQTESTAVAALVISIVGLFFFPVINAVIALIMASSAKRNIRESGGRLTGEGMATAAQVISWIILVPGILLVGFALLVLLGFLSLAL